MSNINPEETQPNKIPSVEDTMPAQVSAGQAAAPPEPPVVESSAKTPGRKPRRWIVVLGGILLILVLGGLGGLLGYYSGIQQRLQKQASQVAWEAATQYQLGIQDQEAGRLDMARKRFEYVIQIDPTFPGVSDKLAEVMVAMAMASQPTEAAAPTPSPTPDLRGVEDKFNHALQLTREGNWDGVIDTLESLRQEDLNYRTVDIDGLYYIALRNRGINKIKSGSLEPGIYDLALTQQFGPLDNEANGMRNSARQYLSGSSFWEVDWAKVLEYFGPIYSSLPGLQDGSGWTVVERYRFAALGYANQLAQSGDFCGAEYYYNTALSISPDDKIAPTATYVALACRPPTATPEPTRAVTAAPTQEAPQPTQEIPTGEVPTEETPAGETPGGEATDGE